MVSASASASAVGSTVSTVEPLLAPAAIPMRCVPVTV